MKENSSVDELIGTLRDVITAYMEENTVSLAETIGSLECLKQIYIEQAFEDDEEENQ